mgnify:CR=1 FL=1
MGFFDKIKAGLTKTREALSGTLGSVFSGFSEIDDDFYDELEESLILADLGVDTSVKAVGRLRKAVREQHLKTTEEAREALKEILVDMLSVGDTELNLSTHPSVILVIGVNGVGKTTTIGKIAKQLTSQGKKVMLVAGDTFRAAAADQLEIWAGRSGASIVRQHEGADPASVVFDGIQSAKARDVDVILIDTAGRLHNKTNLMNELNKISRAEKQIFSFREFIKTHQSFYIERCNNKHINFVIDINVDFDLRLNRGMLNQVFDNLFSNAEYWLDYSVQQGLISQKQYNISTIERGIIVVWDNGIGISPDIETRLFDPFETKKKEGRGLGLYIAAGNLKYSSSRIRLLNERNQFGNMFKFEIDVSQVTQ